MHSWLQTTSVLINSFLCRHSGSVSIHIAKMLELFKTGHEYMVVSDCYVRTQIGMVRLNKLVQSATECDY